MRIEHNLIATMVDKINGCFAVGLKQQVNEAVE